MSSIFLHNDFFCEMIELIRIQTDNRSAEFAEIGLYENGMAS